MTASTTQAAPQTPEIGRSLAQGDIVTNYHDRGQGRPLLLIHGSGPGVTAWANWRLIIPKLAEHARVVAPDMAGFGYTTVASGRTPDIGTWLGQAVDLMDRLGLEQVSILGNSFGGAIALALADAHPERVRDLVLMGSAGVSFPLTEGLDAVWGYTPSKASMGNLLRVFVHDPSFLNDELIEMRYRASIRADVQDRFSALFPAPRQGWIDMLALPDERLRKIGHRTLLIHGHDDRVVPLYASQRLAQLLPNAKLEVIERCGHWVQIEQAEIFTKLVSDFLLGPDVQPKKQETNA